MNHVTEKKYEEYLDVFYKHKIGRPVMIDFTNDIEGKMDLLFNDQNVDSIINTMVKDEYFYKLVIS